MSDDDTKDNRGAVKSDATVKAGCGIRYDPDVIGEDTGFDFSASSELLDQDDENEKTSGLDSRKEPKRVSQKTDTR